MSWRNSFVRYCRRKRSSCLSSIRSPAAILLKLPVSRILYQAKYKRKGINGKDERIDDSKHLVFENHHEKLRNYRKFASLTVTCEDAKEYMYSLSSKRRVHKWTDIQVNLYI